MPLARLSRRSGDRAPAAPRAPPSTRARARRGRRGRSRSRSRASPSPATERRMRSSPSLASTGRSSPSGAPAYVARSPTSCAIFVPDGVTRWSNIARGDVLLARGSARVSAPSTWSWTICSAPPSRRERLERGASASRRSAPRPTAAASRAGGTASRCGRRRSPPSTAPRPDLADADLAGDDLVEHRVDELRLDLDALVAPRRARLYSAIGPTIAARAAARLEVLEAEVVPEHVRDPALEGVELGERVLADREQEVHPQVGRCSRPRGSRPRTCRRRPRRRGRGSTPRPGRGSRRGRRRGVCCHVRSASASEPVSSGGRSAPPSASVTASATALRSAAHGVVAPRVEDDDREPRLAALARGSPRECRGGGARRRRAAPSSCRPRSRRRGR